MKKSKQRDPEQNKARRARKREALQRGALPTTSKTEKEVDPAFAQARKRNRQEKRALK